MNNLFIPYEEALELKKLGFDEPCFSAYRNTDGERELMGLSKWKNGAVHDNHEGFCAAPIYQQAFDFFKDKHELVVDWNHGQHDNFGSYIGVCIKNIHFEETIVGVYKTYEEARLECVKKLIIMCKK